MNESLLVAGIERILEEKGVHLSTHSTVSADEGGYCYCNRNGYDYTDHLSDPVSVRVALGLKWITEIDGILSGVNELEGISLKEATTDE